MDNTIHAVLLVRNDGKQELVAGSTGNKAHAKSSFLELADWFPDTEYRLVEMVTIDVHAPVRRAK